MSTTSTFQGMDTDAKPSSRVLAPPGGGSSNIFGSPTGTEGPGAAQKRANNTRNQSDVLNQGQPPAPAPAQAPAPKIAYNPITGQPYETQKPAAANEKQEDATADDAEKKGAEGAENKAPEAGNKGAGESGAAGVNSDNFRSTRVSQPPGGRSTALW